MTGNRGQFTERRNVSASPDSCWDVLTLAQKFAVNSMMQFGFVLAFVRINERGSPAVLQSDSRFVVITNDGEINTTPQITVRH